MAFEPGTKAIIKIDDGTNVLRDLSAYLTGSGLPRSVDSVETTTFGKTKKVYRPGLEDGTISLEGKADATVDGWLDSMRQVADLDFEYYPFGDAGGAGTNVKYAGKCVLTSYELSDDVADVVPFSAEFQQSDAVTRSLV